MKLGKGEEGKQTQVLEGKGEEGGGQKPGEWMIKAAPTKSNSIPCKDQ